jgi:ligand-binding SRPBCC domain-containing protein
VQVSGPFAAWKHEHEFEAVDSKTTRVVDRVTYRPPLGPLGFLADWLLIRWQVHSMLRYRSNALRKVFGE